MMTIGVVSDTHMPGKTAKFPEELLKGLEGADLILHAGDINQDHVIYQLEELAPVAAVAGNTDDWWMERALGSKKLIRAEDAVIGLVHGYQGPGSTLERVKRAFAGEQVNCVVFGHSHIPFQEVIDGVLYFNPGSPTDKRRQEMFSYGILRVSGTCIEGEIRYFR
jgi:putative phosphoesterase